MQVKLISIIVLLLTLSSIQWGVSSGEELNGKLSNNRPQRQIFYTTASPYTSNTLALWIYYVIYVLVGLCVCIAPCVIIGIIACVALCVTGAASSSHRNAPTHVTTTQAVPYPNQQQQPYNSSYPQPVQTPAYYPPGPPSTVKAPADV